MFKRCAPSNCEVPRESLRLALLHRPGCFVLAVSQITPRQVAGVNPLGSEIGAGALLIEQVSK